MLAKAQLHFHTNLDPKDTFLKYSPYQAIDKAAKFWYKFISFTHHQKFIFDTKWQEYAFEKWIILIPWVEFEINKKHILILNSKGDVHNIKTYDQLFEYKKNNPEVFIIAPHPFYPAKYCLRKDLFKYHYIFDAVEFSSLYMRKFWNRRNLLAKKFALHYDKAIVGNADIHDLKFINSTYSLVDVDFDVTNIDIKYIDDYICNFFDNIRKNNVSIVSTPFNLKNLLNHNLFFVKWWTLKYAKNIWLSLLWKAKKSFKLRKK